MRHGGRRLMAPAPNLLQQLSRLLRSLYIQRSLNERTIQRMQRPFPCGSLLHLPPPFLHGTPHIIFVSVFFHLFIKWLC